jgi:DNA-binding NarL/FixJ family response regulator
MEGQVNHAAGMSMPGAMPAGAPVRIVLADDHDIVRAAIAALLELMPGVEVAATAQDGADLLATLAQVSADLVITDLAMPMMDGLEAIGRILALRPEARVIVLSMNESEQAARQAMAAGAAGYIVKSAAPAELEVAIRSVLAGGCYLSPRIARALSVPPAPPPHAQLTPRQLEVLELIAKGNSAKQIAWTLGLSSKTIDVHRARLMEGLGIHSIAGLTRYAIKHGLVR